MARKLSILVVVALVFGLLSGAAFAEQVRVGLVLSEGGLGDQSFNDAAFRGLLRAEQELGIYKSYVEPFDISEMEDHQRFFADAGMDLVIAIGFTHESAMYAVAEDYPDVRFAIVDTVVDMPNVASLVFEEHEGSFLVGVVAGLMTESDVVGFVGGMEVPLIRKFQVGFEEGVKYVNPNAQVLVGYVGDFNDPGRGKEMAISQSERGADIIYHAAGGTGLGVIEAASERGFYAIGVDSDQDHLAPGTVLTSMVKAVDLAVYEVIKSVVDGTYTAGVRSFGIADGGVGTSEFRFTKDVIPQSVLDAVADAKAKIIAGEIVVTDPTK
ncbi:MAG: BMP family ABC transporter substrate-binding protein [Firmicutes bacterium]|nr:BMP family ABC transporter substrate-binding protein [Bacillota bacterium]